MAPCGTRRIDVCTTMRWRRQCLSQSRRLCSPLSPTARQRDSYLGRGIVLACPKLQPQSGVRREHDRLGRAGGRTPAEPRAHVPNGTNSKPVFERFGGVYYLGWQEAGEGYRRIFNIDVSRDGKTWERKYRFESEKSFQYPSLHEHKGSICLTVTQGVSDPSGKELIMFGKLEETGRFESLTKNHLP